MSDGGQTLYLIDELVVRSGCTDAFFEAFEAEYRPGAEARGMVLVHRWVTPPEAPSGEPMCVVLVWSLAGVAGFWRMRSQNSTPEVAAWWRRCEAWVVSRSRRYAVDAGAQPEFAAAGRVHA